MQIIKSKEIIINDLVGVARKREELTISPESKKLILNSRKVVDEVVSTGKVIYGITTGFGAFKNTLIDKNQTEKLQENLILSHSVGVGDYLSTETVRGIMFLMINYLSKGYSGINWETVNGLSLMLNKGVHPLVPEKGSVGSSGDLAPSAHIALVLIGKGEAEYKGKKMSGLKAMSLAGIKPIKLGSKEGLAIINNTATMSSIASLLLFDTQWLTKIANIVASLSIQALRGTDRAYDIRIHELKPHNSQIKTALTLQELLMGSTFIDRNRVQESYSFRCIPQIHGAIGEAIDYVNKTISTEINSVTDNPLIFTDNGVDVISGGNFHGEAVAIAMDTLGIALSELANVSERRTAALLDPTTNNGLPAFLTEKGGLNSGLMITQYTAASLVSENKVLAHPASVDSIPTSANIENLVSMGTIAARKAREIFENTALVLTIELLASCQAIDLRKRTSIEEYKLSPKTKVLYDFIRKMVPYFAEDTVFKEYIDKLRNNLEKISSLI